MRSLYTLTICLMLFAAPAWSGTSHNAKGKAPAKARTANNRSTPKPQPAIASVESNETTEKDATESTDEIETNKDTVEVPVKEYRPRVNYHYRKTAVKKKKGLF